MAADPKEIEKAVRRKESMTMFACGKIDPVGYIAVDLLARDHDSALVKRKGCSLHHPFD